MCAQIAELLNLSAEVYKKKVRDASALHKIIDKCKELLLANNILDDSGNFTRLLDPDREIELKKLVELQGYCYYLTKNVSQAQKAYRVLILSDDSPFNAWDEDVPFSKVETFYTNLRDNWVKILNLQKASSQEKEKENRPEQYKEFYSLYFSLGYYTLAIEYLEKYLLEEPADFEYWYMLAEYYEYKENYPQAIRCLENAYNHALSEGYSEEAEGYREELAELQALRED